jgi:hypothetical protein
VHFDLEIQSGGLPQVRGSVPGGELDDAVVQKIGDVRVSTADYCQTRGMTRVQAPGAPDGPDRLSAGMGR